LPQIPCPACSPLKLRQSPPSSAKPWGMPYTHACQSIEDALLDKIKAGYATNPFTKKLESATTRMRNITQMEGYWFINECLVVPKG